MCVPGSMMHPLNPTLPLHNFVCALWWPHEFRQQQRQTTHDLQPTTSVTCISLCTNFLHHASCLDLKESSTSLMILHTKHTSSGSRIGYVFPNKKLLFLDNNNIYYCTFLTWSVNGAPRRLRQQGTDQSSSTPTPAGQTGPCDRPYKPAGMTGSPLSVRVN